MRIISGKYKNLQLLSPNTPETHPMGDREKLALFNMIESNFGEFAKKAVLDAFSGSGALGIESLSRGAKTAVFVEKSEKVVKILEKNLKNVEKSNNFSQESVKKPQNSPKNTESRIIKASVSDVKLPENSFDIIFCDPPYDKFDKNQVENLIRFLKPGGVLALSSPKNLEISCLSGVNLVKSRTYARATISLFQKL